MTLDTFFQRMIKETPNEFLESLKADLANEIYFYKNLKDMKATLNYYGFLIHFILKLAGFQGIILTLYLYQLEKIPPL